jgi:hypothetical protein
MIVMGPRDLAEEEVSTNINRAVREYADLTVIDPEEANIDQFRDLYLHHCL